MRFYQYSATDSSGRPATGTIRAASVDSARDALVQAGYQVSQVTDPGPQTAAQQDRALRQAVQPKPLRAVTAAPVNLGPLAASTPRQSARVEAPSAVQIQAPATTAAPDEGIKTKFGRDKDLFLLFTQLGQYFRAGVTVRTALQDLAKKSPERYQESLLAAEKSVSEGGTLSNAFEKYPYLYSPDVIGTLRAGEVAGFIDQACDQIANQKESSHRLKRKLAYFLILFISMVVCFPLSLAVVNGALRSMAEQDKAGGSLSPEGTLRKFVGLEMLHSSPWMLVLFGGLAAFLLFWHSMRMRNFRHRLVLMFPVLSGRAKAEGMARFTWALGMVSRGGTSPHQTFELAAESVPNLIVRQELMDAAGTMTESERLSVALRRSGALPVEYSHIVETGETTGDVPRALSDINRAVDADFRGRDATASTFTGIILYACLGVVMIVLLSILYRMFYGGMITTVLGDT